MESFLEVDLHKSLVIDGAGVAMSIDPNGDTFYVLHLEGYFGKERKVTELNVVIPPMITAPFLDVVKAMEPKRE